MKSNWSYSPETLSSGQNCRSKLDSNGWFFSPCDLEIWWMTLKIIGHPSYITSGFVHHLKPLGEFKLELLTGNTQFRSKSAIFCPLWPWYLMDDLENNRAPLLCNNKLCVPFRSHWWIQSGVTVRKRPIYILGQTCDFFSCVILKFERWPWKSIGHLS